MRIAKIKQKDGVNEIHFEESRGKEHKEVIFKCTDQAHADLDLAFSGLIPVVYEILELPKDVWPAAMKITGVSFSFSETTEVEGAVITGQVALDNSNAPFCFNTPHLPFEQYSETGESPTMPDKAIEKLERLRDEAQAYMTGKKRAQLQMAI